MVRLIKAHGQKLLNLFTAAMLFGFVVLTSYNFWKPLELEPYAQLRSEVVIGKVSVGGVLRVTGSGVRHRICKAEAHRFFIETQSGQTRHQEIAPSGAVPLGPFARTVDIRLPEFLGPGVYLFRSNLFSDCGDKVYPASFPDVLFEIVSQD